MNIFKKLIFLLSLFWVSSLSAQQIDWSESGDSYLSIEEGAIVQYQMPSLEKNVIVSEEALSVQGKSLKVESYTFSEDRQKVLIFTNSQRVWRYNTRGDYWVYDMAGKALKQLGKDLPESSLMFAKFSPNAKKVAYVSKHNLYVEDLATGAVKKLTSKNGTPKLINGTFDWAYEEEFSLRDGFRWSADNESIAYWQIDANKIRDFYMINNTDSVYSQIVPVEYPKAGDSPSPARIGVVNINSGNTTWMKIEGDPAQHYLTRMEWTPAGDEIIVQQLNRKQNKSNLILCNAQSGRTKLLYTESDDAWVEHISLWSRRNVEGWDWIDNGKAFIWVSEQDGWRHLYRIDMTGKATLLSPGDYDVIQMLQVDEKSGRVFFYASPDNPLQKYLFTVDLKGKGKLSRISPENQEGTHSYDVSTGGKYAFHRFSNYYTPPASEWLDLKTHTALNPEEDINQKIDLQAKANSNISYFKVTTEDDVEIDGWMIKPDNFDENKKYPVVFYVYGEPASTTVKDAYRSANSFLYNGNMAADGYIHISLDNRGTPAPKGRAWRKSIYGKIGQVNIRDQAMAAKKILEWKYVDKDRIAVWGWSGGGTSTLNLMFQYPEIYKTGISIAPVTASNLYDNIYTERYMGLPQENKEDYYKGAPLTHAKNLQGNLLLIHGTGDDNVHYQNTEMLLNELIKHQKLFSFMAYPNRTHGIYEGEGTRPHLYKLVTNYLRQNCPPGAK